MKSGNYVTWESQANEREVVVVVVGVIIVVIASVKNTYAFLFVVNSIQGPGAGRSRSVPVGVGGCGGRSWGSWSVPVGPDPYRSVLVDTGRYCPDYQMRPKCVRIFYMFNDPQLILQKRTVNGGQRRLV